MSAPDLARNRRVGDLRIVRQQECLAEDDRERAVSLEWQEETVVAGNGLLGHNA